MIAAVLLGATGGLVIALYQVDRRLRAQRHPHADVRAALRLVASSGVDGPCPSCDRAAVWVDGCCIHCGAPREVEL